jgi:hypothetical protein
MRTHPDQGQTSEQMVSSRVRVLLVDENLSGMSHVAAYLRSLGCLCSFARSLPEAHALLLGEKFNLVLTKFVLSGGGCHDLVAQLAGDDSSLFYYFAVEDSCLWIPRVRSGEECWGEPALRPGEFAGILKDLIFRMRGNVQAVEGGKQARPIRIPSLEPRLQPLDASARRIRPPYAETDLGTSTDHSEADRVLSDAVSAARR